MTRNFNLAAESGSKEPALPRTETSEDPGVGGWTVSGVGTGAESMAGGVLSSLRAQALLYLRVHVLRLRWIRQG